MISHISATYVYSGAGPALKYGVLAIDSAGIIQAVYTEQEAKNKKISHIQTYEGLLVPGFVNTHCHLELSYLKGKIPKGTGLPEFVKSIVQLRSSDELALTDAMIQADQLMYSSGIVAVGDISNQLISKSIKLASSIYYFTFLEIMGFHPDSAKEVMKRARALKNEYEPLPISIVPHAPYSVSADLFHEISEYVEFQDGPISIHNQESKDENSFFKQKLGGFLELFDFLGQDIGHYQPSGKTSLQSYLSLLPPQVKTLLVHNTFTTEADVAFAKSIHSTLYWCLCPNANLYIENTLPDVNMLRKTGVKITIGTDSLASNDRLSILSEMNLLQDHFDVTTEELLEWATLNGAEFLGIEQRYGSFEVGKSPGVNLVDFKIRSGKVILGNDIQRLF